VPTRPTIVRFVEAFIAVFVVSLAADPIFGGNLDLFGADGLRALVSAVVAAAALALRRALAVAG
jgi:hypothetical protein